MASILGGEKAALEVPGQGCRLSATRTPSENPIRAPVAVLIDLDELLGYKKTVGFSRLALRANYS